MAYIQRTPEFTVSILRPNYLDAGELIEELVYSFSSNAQNILLLSYVYDMDLASFEGPFSLTFTPQVISENGDTILEKVKMLDIVKIEEFGKIKYLGLVGSKRFSGIMTDSGPERSITISGYCIGGVLARFNMLLDQIILADAQKNVTSLNNNLRAFIAEISGTYGENSSMTRIFTKIAETFRTAQEKIGGFPAGTGIYKVIDKYMRFSTESDKLNTKYPMALSVFGYGGNNLLGIWQELVFKPFYEFFIRWDSQTNSYLLVLRPTPFDPAAWIALKATELLSLHVTAIDLGFPMMM